MATNDHNHDADYEEGSFIDRIKESPRTVSALIIILIVAAAIYAFSGDDAPTTNDQADQATVTTEESAEESSTEGEENADTAMEETDTAATKTAAPSTPVTQDQMQEAAANLPEPRRSDSGFVEVAQAGDGITHLSRRAVTRWLAENQAGYEVTNEHRIYIEDYIQNGIGSNGLSLGQEQEISFELIKEAVEAANQLNNNQLQNLSQYTYVLT